MRAAANQMMQRLAGVRAGASATHSEHEQARPGEFARLFESLELGGVWKTDVSGRFVQISDSIWTKLANSNPVGNTTLVGLFEAGQAEAEAIRNLHFAMTRRKTFKRVVIETGTGADSHFWSLSGAARFDDQGVFAGYHGVCSDITSDRRDVEETSQMAMHDPLTGLLNRRRMGAVLEQTLAAYKHRNQPCATMLIDLDRFKQVNDTLGHTAGDTLLKLVADRLISVVGDREQVCRLGGDEFQIFLPGKEDRGELGELAERIISMISQPYTIDGSRCIIGASVGVAISPFDGETQDELVRNADLALYAAKHTGRGRFRFFSKDLLEAAEQRRALEDDLHDALVRGDFEIQYQPLVKSDTNRVSGAEALIRWNHPVMGRVSPAVFIPIAEECNLIGRIGEWVLRHGCAEAATWPAPLRVAINVSPLQFVDPGFPLIVAQALSSSGLAPDRLELEITEGVFLAESSATDETFKALKRLGVRLALDDFGTGYSSLAYLKTAPFDKIKIDQSFVRGATVDDIRNRAIILAIVSLANALGMETTAEGVETFDQLDLVRELGVSHVQGHIYSAAMEKNEFISQASQAEWGIEPNGYAKQRYERIRMYRKIGAIHVDHYYTVMLRNMSQTGALIEGLIDVPVGTQFVLDFGEGQLEVATVRRSRGPLQGVEFENSLVRDGDGGLCTRSRISPYLLTAAGLPDYAASTGPTAIVGEKGSKVSLPTFLSVTDRRAIIRVGQDR